MGELDVKQQLHLLQKEVEAAVSLTEDIKLNLISAIDSLKIEVEVLKKLMQRYHPDFARFYSEVSEKAMRELDPEWIEGGTSQKSGAAKER